MSPNTRSNELKLTRVYDAPVRMVWDAWTDPEQVAQWWGPRGFTITTHSKDLRPGGHWAYTMHGPDGTDFENKTLYHEVEECAKLVYDHGGNDDRPPLFRVKVTFCESGGKTTMAMTMTLATPEAAEEIKKHIRQAGGNATWDRLAEYLEKRETGREKFVITRSLAATREEVFAMWTKPELMEKWPPKGFTIEYLKADIRVGGGIFYRMKSGEMLMHGRGDYREIQAPERLVYTQQFCDAEERVTRHPLAAAWPETMLTTVVFVEEEPGVTRVTLTSEVEEPATSEEIAVFAQMRGNMTQGWTGALDQMEEVLGAGE